MIEANNIKMKRRRGWVKIDHAQVKVIDAHTVWLGLYAKRIGNAPPVILEGSPRDIVRLFVAIGADIIRQRQEIIGAMVRSLKERIE